MSVERKQIQHYHTTNSEAIPTASDLLNGEIALNINKGNEKIFIKNNEGGISSFRGEQYYEENFLHKNDTAQSAIDLTGRIEATPEEFKYRPSAGEKSIKDDSATIKRIKGGSLVWNQVAQLRDSGELNGLTFTKENDILRVSGTVTEAFSYDTCHLTTYLPQGLKRDGRKYLISINAPDGIAYGLNGYSIVNTKPHFWSAEADSVWFGYISIKIPVGTTVDYVFSNPQIIDLTQMFGAGYEPTTLDEFYARIPEGVDINAHNEGELINFTAESIKTTGFNQWDEQWEKGVYHIWEGGTGGKLNGGNYEEYIRSANHIDVLPNTTYCILTPNDLYVTVGGFNKNNVFIGQIEYVKKTTSYALITTPKNCNKIVFYVKGDKYNDNICINLSHSGVRDGEYEPYKEFTHDLSWIKKYFPNGMKSAGSAYDEIVFDESKQKWVAIQRIGEVDLGSLTAWENHLTGVEGTYNFVSYIPDAVLVEASKIANIVCSNLHVASGDNVYLRKYTNAIALTGGSNKIAYIAISHPTYTTSAQKSEFMTSIQGIILYYELAEPIVTEIDDIVNFSYEVGDFGTEEIISNNPTTPFKGDIVYQFNAVDRIRDNSRDIEKLKNRLNNGVKPYVIDALEFANELGNFSSDETGGFSGNGHITQEQYNEIIKAVENKNLIFSVANTYWNYAALKSPYQGHILISTRIDPAIPGFGGLFYDIMMFIDEETLECSVVLDGRGDISSLLDRNLKTVNGEALIGSGNINIAGGSSLVSILHGELVNLRDNNGLIPGTWYRITDYIATTSQENTSSAGHPFDVIVTALDENTLSEEAYAIKSERDTDNYFGTSNLSAWKIKYTLDNDTDKFTWADSANGKGVIYYMKDEWSNECPYDFKNIQFKRKLTNGVLDKENGIDTWCYTFNAYCTDNANMYDASVIAHKEIIDDDVNRCYGNIIKEYYEVINYVGSVLNDIVFLNIYSIESMTYFYCYSNTFGSECQYSTFGNNCYSNTFGNGCYSNTFGYRCIFNSFINSCIGNTFGNNCSFNSFGIGCGSNSFGNECSFNSFGVGCSSNSLGNNCNYNSFGNNCSYNSFRNSASKTDTLKDYCHYNHFDDGCSRNIIWNSDTTSNTIKLKNVNVNRGVVATGNSYNFINIDVLNQDYEIRVAKNSSGEIKVYCEADLIP